MLKNFHFNLKKTNNSPKKLLYINQESINKMNEENFYFRPCNINCEELKTRIMKDGNFVEQDCELGYR